MTAVYKNSTYRYSSSSEAASSSVISGGSEPGFSVLEADLGSVFLLCSSSPSSGCVLEAALSRSSRRLGDFSATCRKQTYRVDYHYQNDLH